MKPRIHLIIMRPDGHGSNIKGEGAKITPAMLDAAEDLRPAIEGLYDACALAFGTTREDAKKRLTGAMYNMRGKPTS